MSKFKKPIAKRKDLILAKLTNEERGRGGENCNEDRKPQQFGSNSKEKQYSGVVLATSQKK